MTRVTAIAVLFFSAVGLAGCSGFGNDPFGWGESRTWGTAGQSAAPAGGDMGNQSTTSGDQNTPPGQTMSGSGETTNP